MANRSRRSGTPTLKSERADSPSRPVASYSQPDRHSPHPSPAADPESPPELLSQLLELAKLPAVVTQLRRELDALRTEIEHPKATASEPLLDVDEAATLLGMTPAALRQAVYRGTVRPVRLGRRLRFRRTELLGRLAD